jgi:caspase domain-containing protein
VLRLGGGRQLVWRLAPVGLVLVLVGAGIALDDFWGSPASHPKASVPKVAGTTLETTSPDPGLEAASVWQEPASSSTTSMTRRGRRRERPVVAPAVFSGRKAKALPPPRVLGASGPKEGGAWAVIIGIDDYPGVDHDLRQAASDARAADAALQSYGIPASRRLVLLDGQATTANIRGALHWLADHAAPEATAVVFYAGHVRQVFDRRGGPVHAAVIGADGNHIIDTELARILTRLEARSAWIAMAACYGAGFDETLAPGRVLTASAGADEIAYENEGLQNSYLVEYMVQRAMIDGRAPESVQESFGWARTAIAHDFPDRQPVMLDQASAPVVLRQPGAPRRSQSTPVPAQSPPPSPEPESEPPSPSPILPQPPPACPGVIEVGKCGKSGRF